MKERLAFATSNSDNKLYLSALHSQLVLNKDSNCKQGRRQGHGVHALSYHNETREDLPQNNSSLANTGWVFGVEGRERRKQSSYNHPPTSGPTEPQALRTLVILQQQHLISNGLYYTTVDS